MKQVTLLLFSLLLITSVFGQTDPIEFNNALVVEQSLVTAKNLEYVSYSVHAEDYNEVERKRKEVIKQIQGSITRVTALTPPENGVTLKGEALEVLNMYKTVFSMDFAEVTELKKDSESSYEAMERYFKAQDKVEKQLEKAGDRFEKAQERFAKKNDFKIVKSEGDDPLSEQIKKMNEVNEYTRKIFLTYFKADKAHAAFMEAMNNEEKSLDSKRRKMESTASEAITALSKMSGFDGDKAYLESARKLMKFYKNLAQNEFADVVRVTKLKQKDLTQADVDAYNEAIQKYNEQINPLITDFNSKYDALLKKYVPNVGVPKNKVQRL